MTSSVLERHSPVVSLFKYNISHLWRIARSLSASAELLILAVPRSKIGSMALWIRFGVLILIPVVLGGCCLLVCVTSKNCCTDSVDYWVTERNGDRDR